MSAVRPFSTVFMALCTARSAGMSSADVASSRITTGGLARNARAREMSCRCPAENRPPPLCTSVP